VSVAAADPVARLLQQTVYTPVRQGSAVAETVARLGRAIGMGLLRSLAFGFRAHAVMMSGQHATQSSVNPGKRTPPSQDSASHQNPKKEKTP